MPRYYLAKNDDSGKVYLEGMEHPKPEPKFSRARAQGEVITMMPGPPVSGNRPTPGLETTANYGVRQGRLVVKMIYCSRATYLLLEALHVTGATCIWGVEHDDGVTVQRWEVDFMPEEQGWRETPLDGTHDYAPLEMEFLEIAEV